MIKKENYSNIEISNMIDILYDNDIKYNYDKYKSRLTGITQLGFRGIKYTSKLGEDFIILEYRTNILIGMDDGDALGRTLEDFIYYLYYEGVLENI